MGIPTLSPPSLVQIPRKQKPWLRLEAQFQLMNDLLELAVIYVVNEVMCVDMTMVLQVNRN
jgi:hypothetical protein